MTQDTDLLQDNVTSKTDNQKLRKKDIAESDYLENMFQDGDNRTANDNKSKTFQVYDRAAHTIDSDSSDTEIITPISTSRDTSHSRDGTDASGLYDESGGPLGGTEEELDSLEAGGTPVDRNPHMKDSH